MGEKPTGAATLSSVRPIALLSAAAFVSTATVRVADPLLPLVAHEFGVTPAGASVIATSAALAYGLCQIFYGSLGDRFGKYTVIAVATFFSALLTAAAALADSLMLLGILRFLSGAAAAAVIPLSIAHIGDTVSYEGRQTVLARFLSGQILGVLFGQAFGGVFADHFGWRGIFLVLGALYLVIDLLLWIELASPRVNDQGTGKMNFSALAGRYMTVLRLGRVRSLLTIVSIEGFLFFGGFTFLGAYMRHEFDLSYGAVGVLLACFGVGGMIYSMTVKLFVGRLGERRMAFLGGILLALGFIGFALAGVWWGMAPAVVVAGVGFYMHHNTLQTNATQMAPEARGLAISLFASSFYCGQALGVVVCGIAIDTLGYASVFWIIGGGLLALGLAFGATLKQRSSPA